ncbi:MAG: glycoside hydrolase domain-containing protein [Mangrovibacterium sp.]
MSGLYPYSPAEDDYLISVPVFDRVELKLNGQSSLTIQKKGSGQKINQIALDNRQINDYFVPHKELLKREKLIIITE